MVCRDEASRQLLEKTRRSFTGEHGIRRAGRLDIRYTPKHGSWLNMAETELSVLQNQCLGGRRIPSAGQLTAEMKARETACNARQAGADWQCTTKDARIKLLYLITEMTTAPCRASR